MIAQPQSALRVSPAVSDFPRNSVPRLAVAAPPQQEQRASHSPALAGLLQVFTCVHRNYFTRVMAQALRNAGQGTPTLIVQFLKGGCNQGPDQPMHFGQALDWVRCRLEHCINSAPQAEGDFVAVRELWAFTREAIASGKYDSVVLDELSLAIAYGIIPEAEVVDCLESRPSHIEVTLTGQKMPQSLLKMADQVTELRNIFNTVLPEPVAPAQLAVAPPPASIDRVDAPVADASGEAMATAEDIVSVEPVEAIAPVEEVAKPAEIVEPETLAPSAEAPLMQLGLGIAGVEAATPHDLHLEMPPVDELLVKYSEAHDQEIAEANAIQAKANRKSRYAGKRPKRRSETQISLPGFD